MLVWYMYVARPWSLVRSLFCVTGRVVVGLPLGRLVVVSHGYTSKLNSSTQDLKGRLWRFCSNISLIHWQGWRCLASKCDQRASIWQEAWAMCKVYV